MIKVCIAGAAGKMGRALIETCIADESIEIGGLLESQNSPAVGERISGMKVGANPEEAFDSCDCLIDFTSPEASIDHLKLLLIPVVIGTTGFSDEQINAIKEYSVKFPVVCSPNMSKGINLFFSLVGKVAEKLEDYDIEIVESHHNKKKDAPSGTAVKLAEEIKKVRKLDLVYGREGQTGPRKKTELGIHAVRAGDIVGEHSVIFAGSGECFEISHRAYSRNCFAGGAVSAVKWLSGRKPGFYGMAEVLSL